MAKPNGTHSLLREKERFVQELIERKFGVSLNVPAAFQRSATSTRIPGGVIFYSDCFAVLFRDGKLWDVAQHGLAAPVRASVQALAPSAFRSAQAAPMPGPGGVLGDGQL